jgi:GntR family transcriptional repressor for pyruvate dehydrogenase complex
MTANFTPVSRRTVSEEVRERLAASIRSGQIAPGQPLPSERSLCEDFGVARTSVREAIQGLVTVGVIERRGNRSYVKESLPELGFDHSVDERKIRVRQLFEVRRIVEIPTAEMAAERATDEQREELRALAHEFSGAMTLDEFRFLDRQFHTTVARAADNPILAEVELKVLEALFTSTDFDSLLFAQPNAAVVSRIVRESGQAHRAIAKAIVAGDPPGTVDAARAHLDQVEERMLRQLR